MKWRIPPPLIESTEEKMTLGQRRVGERKVGALVGATALVPPRGGCRDCARRDSHITKLPDGPLSLIGIDLAGDALEFKRGFRQAGGVAHDGDVSAHRSLEMSAKLCQGLAL